MRLITKEIVAKALLLDPAKHKGMIDRAMLLLRNRDAYAYEAAEQVKGGLAFRIPNTGELVMVDEEELVGLTVKPNAALKDKHAIEDLPALIAWATKGGKA
ncbi:hypothetical protein [Methylobacterium oryzae]|uniref:hypothetical protein n=1 Tax=Methylobacterium oryzae TaxID=334852 RepID=UPI001F2962CF|nr:hypothetical protein [Methylobacterium oryzae]UIN38390.1 hypothetical protein LXM90_30880 [Methylobacterium oryzae]